MISDRNTYAIPTSSSLYQDIIGTHGFQKIGYAHYYENTFDFWTPTLTRNLSILKAKKYI
jgi:hypothetical protein